MMDPLSITASALTLLATIGVISTTIKRLRDSHTELLACLDELTDFRTLVEQSRSLTREHGESILSDQRRDLLAFLNRATEKVRDLDNILNQHVVRTDAKGKTRVSRLAWSTHESRIKAILDNLRSIKISLGTLLTSMSM